MPEKKKAKKAPVKKRFNDGLRFHVMEHGKHKDGSIDYGIWDDERGEFVEDPHNELNHFSIVEVMSDPNGTKRYAVFYNDPGPWPDEGNQYVQFERNNAIKIENKLNRDLAIAMRNKLELKWLNNKTKDIE